MSKIDLMKDFVAQRLSAAAGDIFGLLEKTLLEYEDEVSRVKQENERQRQMLDAILKPGKQRDADLLSVPEEEVSSVKQEWSPSLVQEESESPHIKEEEEELWISQEEEQLQGVEEEADIIKFPFTSVPVKSENDEEEAQSSHLHQSQTEEEASSSTEQMKAEADGEDCGLSEPARNLDPAADVQPASDGQFLSSHCCETMVEIGEDEGMETRELQSGLKTLTNKNLVSGKSFTVEKPSSNAQRAHHLGNMQAHIKKVSGEKAFSCSVCAKSFSDRGTVKRHMRLHTGEKPFCCSVCGTRFSESGALARHMRGHTGEKPFSCSVCHKSFSRKERLVPHMRSHTGEKPFSCPVCGKCFTVKDSLKTHMKVHTGEAVKLQWMLETAQSSVTTVK